LQGLASGNISPRKFPKSDKTFMLAKAKQVGRRILEMIIAILARYMLHRREIIMNYEY